MNDFFEKWRNDNKYRAKIKLLVYTFFVIVVSVYALSINSKIPENISNIEETKKTEISKKIIDIPPKYNYIINVQINDSEYKYSGEKTETKQTIIKETSDEIINYIYENNNYYVLLDESYLKTTKDQVYDIVNYNYISLDNINTYLSKATNNNNQYLVYLKDIILGNDSDDYLVILIKDNNINIDYTPLVKQIDNNIQKYIVDIKIEKKD